jgi:hypothetical protein
VWEGKRGKEILFCRKLRRDFKRGKSAYHWVQNCFLLPNATTCSMNFRVFPTGCGDSVADL